MGSKHNSQSFMQQFGNKISQGAAILATMKGIYDTGNMIYRGAQFAAPLLTALL